MEKQRDFKVLDGFVLKILAIVFMTIDHIGFFLKNFENMQKIVPIFTIIGRLSFPLIIFLLVEGIIHSKNIGKYFIRLGAVAVAFLIGQLLYYYFAPNHPEFLSPAVDLLLTASCVYLLKRKDKWSWLAILPFAWAIFVLIIRNYEIIHIKEIKWIPFFLRPDYSIYGPLLGIGFYYSNQLAKSYLSSKEETKSFIGTTYEQTTKNVICAVFLIILTIAICFIDQYAANTYYAIPWQVYALFAFIPILFYSGKRGYNPKWFQYGCYVYFPTHFIILFIIFQLLL